MAWMEVASANVVIVSEVEVDSVLAMVLPSTARYTARAFEDKVGHG